MTAFIYKAIDAAGQPVHGEVEAASQHQALDRISRDGLVPLRLTLRGKGFWARINEPMELRRRVGFAEVAAFTRALARLLSAGVTLERSLAILIQSREAGTERSLLERLQEALKKGESLAGALTKETAVFPVYYVNMVRAGELSGSLEASFGRLATMLERALRFQNEIRSALIYPAILLSMIALTMILVVTVVLPEFEAIFASAGAELPASTRLVMAFGAFVTDWWWVLLLGLAGLFAGARHLLRKAPLRLKFDRRILGLPLLGPGVVRSELVRFLRTSGTMLDQGIGLDIAWKISSRVTRNRAIGADLADAVGEIKEGERATSVLGGLGYVPPVVLQLVQVGEETGNLGGMMVEAADILEDEQELVVKRFLTIFTPAITLFLGGMVAAFVAAVLLGILSINDLAV
jgi:general secretion pathway protein F